MDKKTNNWVENVLLPDLFTKYQARDKRYPSIIISQKQADYIESIGMEQKTIGGGLLGGRIGFYKEGHWQGRTIQISARGQYHFISFGMTQEEHEEAAKEAEKSDFQREKEMAERVTARKNNSGSVRAWEAMFAKYQSKCESIAEEIADYEQNEPKNPFLPLMRKRLHEAQEIFTILKK